MARPRVCLSVGRLVPAHYFYGLSLSAIAFAAGFGDFSTFNRRFQRIMGLSPSAFLASTRKPESSKGSAGAALPKYVSAISGRRSR
ncbi:MAG: helix-turn-helix domain-containing protein [Xanthobacteraceae bacterium]